MRCSNFDKTNSKIHIMKSKFKIILITFLFPVLSTAHEYHDFDKSILDKVKNHLTNQTISVDNSWNGAYSSIVQSGSKKKLTKLFIYFFNYSDPRYRAMMNSVTKKHVYARKVFIKLEQFDGKKEKGVKKTYYIEGFAYELKDEIQIRTASMFKQIGDDEIEDMRRMKNFTLKKVDGNILVPINGFEAHYKKEVTTLDLNVLFTPFFNYSLNEMAKNRRGTLSFGNLKSSSQFGLFSRNFIVSEDYVNVKANFGNISNIFKYPEPEILQKIEFQILQALKNKNFGAHLPLSYLPRVNSLDLYIPRNENVDIINIPSDVEIIYNEPTPMFTIEIRRLDFGLTYDLIKSKAYLQLEEKARENEKEKREIEKQLKEKEEIARKKSEINPSGERINVEGLWHPDLIRTIYYGQFDEAKEHFAQGKDNHLLKYKKKGLFANLHHYYVGLLPQYLGGNLPEYSASVIITHTEEIRQGYYTNKTETQDEIWMEPRFEKKFREYFDAGLVCCLLSQRMKGDVEKLFNRYPADGLLHKQLLENIYRFSYDMKPITSLE